MVLQIRRMLHRSATHCSDGVTACLLEVGGGAGACIWKGCCSGICWLGGCRGGGGRTRPVLIPFRCASVASARSTMVRAEMTYRGSIVAALNQSRNSAILWVIPMASAFACIIFHTVAGASKGGTIRGWTREKGDRDARGTETLSVLGASWGRWECPGARRTNKASISSDCGTAKSSGVSHYGYTTTVAGSIPRRMSLAKLRTFPYSGVGCAKYGITN